MPCQIKPQGAQTMTTPQHLLLCQYRYDPLDRLTGLNQPGTAVNQRFYCKSRLATQIQGAIGHAIFQHEDILLAQQERRSLGHDSTLLATDLQRSVLHAVNVDHPRQSIAYSTYGHRRAESGLTTLLGFNGERRDPLTGHYLLGNGYRAFNPVLMRFNSPDSWSPFGNGGINSYAYCLGDPINKTDGNGHGASNILQIVIAKKIARSFRINKILPKRLRFQTPHSSMTPTQRLKASDELLQIKDDFKNIHSHQDSVFNLDYENRKTPNLKNLSAGAVKQANLPTDDLPATLQKFVKTPHLPPNSSDLLESLKTNANPGRAFDVNSLLMGKPLPHSSGRTINPTITQAYYDRINQVVHDVREATMKKHYELPH
jgi:RHS repeat-associated protein